MCRMKNCLIIETVAKKSLRPKEKEEIQPSLVQQEQKHNRSIFSFIIK
jgi:hypothetical protein